MVGSADGFNWFSASFYSINVVNSEIKNLSFPNYLSSFCPFPILEKNTLKSFRRRLKCTFHQNIFDMWKGHILGVHCTNIQIKRFIE